jgi:hypothetical protein
MVALKDSPIWWAIGEGVGGYDDVLDNPFPPFAFNSGMAWRAVPRAECEALGLITEGETVDAMEAQLSPGQKDVQETLQRLGPEFQGALLKELEELAA